MRNVYLIVVFSFISHSLISLSVLRFERPFKRPKTPKNEPAPQIDMYFLVLDGISGLGAVTLFSVDFLGYWFLGKQDFGEFDMMVLKLALVLFCVAMVGMYALAFGGVREFFETWRPFQGPEFFVMCEAVAWTVFATAGLGNLMIINSYSLDGRTYLAGMSSALACGYLFSYVTIRYAAQFLLGRGTNFRAESTHTQDKEIPQKDSPRYYLHVFSLVVTHVSAALFVSCDWESQHLGFFGVDCGALFWAAVVSSMFGIFLIALRGLLFIRGFQIFQPFKGGSDFVSLQAIGYILVAMGSTLALVCANFGVVNLRLPGVISTLGSFFYFGQLALLRSLSFFVHTQKFTMLDGRVGILLGSASMFLFFFVDFFVIRFGLPVQLYQFVIAAAWISACASVPLSAWVLFKSKKEENKTRTVTGFFFTMR